MELEDFKRNIQYQTMTLEPRVKDEEWLEYSKTFCYLNYHTYPLLKPNGRGLRWIQAPNSELKSVQRRILGKLKYVKFHPSVYGLGEKDYVQNALVHRQSKNILRIDLKDFYKNCTLLRLKKTIAPKDLSSHIQHQALYIFYAGQTTNDFKDVYLSTGSPLSPLVANAAVTAMDFDLDSLTGEYGGNYTRYLDDMTFSLGEISANGIMMNGSF